jgi:general secretion pathway protein K
MILNQSNRQAGAILIIVLWFIAMVIVLVAVLARETRLSATVVFHNKQRLQTWNDTLQALHAAQMELLINRMPDPPGEEKSLNERQKNKRYQFDGRVLELAYPIPETVQVRIYDLAGKINIRLIPPQRMRQLLQKRIGDQPEKLDELEDVWQDWIDRDEFKRANGAEKDYYETLSPPYEPRNSRLETVEEFLLMKGFAEVFQDIEIETAFTVYGNVFGVNPNLATREVLMLLPGTDGEIVNQILIKRREKEFKSYQDLNEFIEPEQLAELRPWLHFSTAGYYTIAVQIKSSAEIVQDQEEAEEELVEEPEPETSSLVSQKSYQRAYMITLQPRGFNRLPKILEVNPYGVLPDTSYEQFINEDEEDDYSSDSQFSTPFDSGGDDDSDISTPQPFSF